MACGKHHKLTAPVFIAVLISIGCGGGPNTNQPASNTVRSNTNEANSSNSDPLATSPVKKEESPTNSAPTLTPVVKAYCDAWVKNDEAALRKVHSAETLRSYEADMKMDNVKTLIQFLEDDRATGTPCDVANEQITGDTAIAIVRTRAAPNGVRRVFVKEQGEWKLTNKIPDIDSVKKAANSK